MEENATPMNAPWSQDKYVAAIRFAAEAHTGQTITGTALPYAVHAAQVAMETMAAIAAEGVGDPDLAVQCALLHDVVEDTATPIEAIAETFGPAVASGVAALTKNSALVAKPDSMRDSLARIRQQPREVWMVKLADRISNLMPPPVHWDMTRCAAYQAEARLILDMLGEASPLLAARLAGKIEGYNSYTGA